MSKMRREKHQIIFLQETHLSQNEHEKLKQFGYKNTFYSSLKTGKRGVAILIHNSINFDLVREIRDSEGRYVLVQGKIENKMTTLICVYIPPQSDHSSSMKKILELISSESQGTLICAGDFNTVISNKWDTSNNKRNISLQSKLLRRGFDEMGLLDVWRDLHPSEKDYTFYSAPHAVFSRIDYIFMFQNDRHRIQNCEIGTRDISDHSPMYLTLHLDSRPKKTIWRLKYKCA